MSRHRARLLRAVGLFGLTLGWLAGTAVSARAAASTGLDINIHMLYPPEAITDLRANPVGSQTGDIQLLWTAPRNQNGTHIAQYQIRYATYPAANVGAAESWFSGLLPSQVIVSPAHAPGVLEFTTVGGLTAGTTYYFGVKSVDAESQISPIDLRTGTGQQAQSLPVVVVPPPPTPTNFAGVAQSTFSITWSWNAAAGAGFYTLNAFPSGSLIAQTSSLFVTESGLTANAAVNRTLKAGNGAGLSPATLVRTVYTLAAVPSTPTVTGLDTTKIRFAWTANGNPAGTQYRVERSLDNLNFVPLNLSPATSYNDTAVTAGTTYYYRVAAVNGDGVASGTSGVFQEFPRQTDFLAPQEPQGLTGTVDASRQAFTLAWEPVVRNADGTPADDIVGYHVYRRTIINGTPVRITTTPVTPTAYADQINGGIYYYTIRAVDAAGNQSAESLLADSSSEANIIYLDQDGQSSITMPEEVSSLLKSGANKYGVPLTVDLVEKSIPNDSSVLRSVQLRLLRGDTRQPVDDIGFRLPSATIAIGYSSVNGEIGRGSPLSAAGVSLAGITAEQLSLFWNNGAGFVKVGGVNDPAMRALTLKTSFLGEYQIRISAASTVLNLDKANVYPRIITPNGDGLNDRVFFILENPNNVDVRGEVFDKDGRFVATLPDPTTTPGIGTTMVWDGRDRDGNVVPGGVYIYRIEGEGRKFTGTVGVAK